jgi:hypothetical protein
MDRRPKAIREGLGMRVIKDLVKAALHDDVTFEFAPAGFAWRLRRPAKFALAEDRPSP